MTDKEKYELPGVDPFHGRYNWDGCIFTMDDTPTDEFTQDDLEEVLWSFDSGDKWDGEVACVCRLKDGRYISWETFFGPTGDGFNGDAYGGDADILCSSSYEAAVKFGLSPIHRPGAELAMKDITIKAVTP